MSDVTSYASHIRQLVPIWLVIIVGCCDPCEDGFIDDNVEATKVPTIHLVRDTSSVYHARSNFALDHDIYVLVSIKAQIQPVFWDPSLGPRPMEIITKQRFLIMVSGEVQSIPDRIDRDDFPPRRRVGALTYGFNNLVITMLPASERANVLPVQFKNLITGEPVILLKEHPFHPYKIGQPSSITLIGE